MFIRLRTARPDDWSGKLTDLAVTVVALLTVIIVVLVRLPESWVALAAGRGWLVRLVLAGLAWWLFMWLDNALRVLLPRTPYLFGRTLTIRARGRRVPLLVREIQAIRTSRPARPTRARPSWSRRDWASTTTCARCTGRARPAVSSHRPRPRPALSARSRVRARAPAGLFSRPADFPRYTRCVARWKSCSVAAKMLATQRCGLRSTNGNQVLWT